MRKFQAIATRSGLGPTAAHYIELTSVSWQLFRLAGFDAIILLLSLLLSFLKVPLAMRLAQSWPVLSAIMDQDGDVGGILLGMFQLSLLLAMVTFVINRLKETFFARLLERIQLAAVRAFLSIDTSFWDTSDPTQQVVWIFQQADRVKSLLGHIEALLYCAFTLGGGILHVYALSPEISKVAVVVMLLTSLYFFWLGRLLGMASGSMDGALSELKAGTIETLMNIRTVQAFAAENLELTRFVGRKGKWWHCKIFFVLVEAVRRGSELLHREARALSVHYGGFLLVTSGLLQVGEVLILQALLTELLVGSYDALVGTVRVISIDLFFAKVFLQMLKTPRRIPLDTGAELLEETRGLVALEDVDFSYPARPGELVLKAVSFRVLAGSFTALLGASGSGKTTVGRLLERFYDVAGGRILLDGYDLRELRPRWLRRQIGYVEQEPSLFQGSLRENIAYGHPSAPGAAVEAAAREALVSAFALSLPGGLDSDVGHGGLQLSGGQKQRVAIARAMLRNPRLVVLDEATSALDVQTERLLEDALARLLAGRTRIVIAHRLSTVRGADQVVILHAGRVVEVGAPRELLRCKEGYYARMMRQEGEPERRAQGIQTHGTTGAPPEQRREQEQQPHSPSAAVAPATEQEQEPMTGAGADTAAAGPVEDYLNQRVPRAESGLQLILFWMYKNLGMRKWILGACVAVSLAEVLVKTQVGPVYGKASAVLDSPAQYMLAFKPYVAVSLAACLLRFLKERLKDFFEPHLAEALQVQCVMKLLRQDVDYFLDHDPSSLVPRLFDQIELCVVCCTMASETFMHGVGTLTLLIREMYVLSPPMVLWTLVLSLPALALFCLAFGVEGRRSQRVQEADKGLYAVVIESLCNIRTVHAFGGESLELRKFATLKQRWWEAEMHKRRMTWLSDGGQLVLTAFVPISLLLILIRSNAGRKSSVTAALLFMVKTFLEELAMVSLTLGVLGEGRGAVRAVIEVLREPSSICAEVGHIPALRAAGAVEFREVSFGYFPRGFGSGAVPVLRGVSLRVSPGSFTAIIGQSGSGKTTLGRLLMRFHEVSSGALLLDGHPLPSLHPQWVRRQVGYVEQEPRLFQETLWNNIRYGWLEAPPEEILKAAMAANVLAFVPTLPQGFDTDVGRCGQALSGGQKQRVALARALLPNPPLLLLDEATSALDAETERSVQEAIERTSLGRTCIAIAHRLSTVSRADQVLVLDQGHVVQSGSHAQLAAEGGVYGQLLPTLMPTPTAETPAPCQNQSIDEEPPTESNAGLRRRH